MAQGMRGPRSSADLAGLSALQAQAYGAQAGRTGLGGHLRPSSEMLPSGINVSAASPEAQALDAWFNDLSNYEHTLEEMAAASLDPSFKEELGAIESWFRVLSEAERTGALYSLLQTCNSIQVRFFLTVLQQMAKADPVGAILSPANPNQPSMESQMESKLANMSLSTPGANRYGRQSLNTDVNAASYLSPNQAPGFDNDSPALQRSQRIKGQRISAPGTLGANDMLKSPIWSNNSTDARQNSRSPSPSPSARPRSTGSELSASQAAHRSPNALDSQLSPMPGGSWASMVNTPLVPMFKDQEDGQAPLEQANSRLQGWGRAVQDQSGQQSGAGGIILDDARKFRRSGRVSNGTGLGSLPTGQPMGALGAFGSSGDTNGLAAPAQSATQRRSSGGQAQYGGRPPLSPASATLLSAQQAAVAAQSNWRNANGLPAAGYAPSPNAAAVANLATMSPQELAQLSMAQLLVQQQQLAQQLSAQQALLGMNSAVGVSPMSLLQLQHQAGLLQPSSLAMGSPAQRRSPRQSNTRSPQATTGSGQDANEEVDISLLNDIPAWLRALRLHKYTDVLRGAKWQDLVIKDDAALEAMGISALGARRKLLRVFAIVREKMNIEAPPGVNLAPPPADADESSSQISPNPDGDESVADLSHTSQA